MLEAAIALAQKDLRCFLRDRGALVASILVPIMLVTVFGAIMAYAFGGGSSGMPKVTLQVCDADGTAQSAQFVTDLAGFDMISVQQIEPGTLDPAVLVERLEKRVASGDAHHILLLPDGFAESVRGGEPKLQMVRDPGRAMEDQVIQIAIMQAALAQSGSQIWTDAMVGMLEDQGMQTQQLESVAGWMNSIGSTIGSFAESNAAQTEQPSEGKPADEKPAVPPEDAGKTAAAAGSSTGMSLDGLMNFFADVIPVETTDVTPPGRKAQVTYQQAQSVAGMSVMMLLFALTSCGSVLLAERDDGTLRRLFAQPINRNAILLGKFMFVFLVGVLQLTILFTYGEAIFRVGLFRDPLTLLVLGLTWVAAGSAFGMFLASACKSAKQSEGLATLLILMMAALGGCWFPLQMMELPGWLEMLCKSTMTYWAMSGFQGMLWNQLAFYEPNMLIALAWQWAWILALGTASVLLYRRNYLAD